MLNTPQMREEFRSSYPDAPEHKFQCVTNGFEEDLLDLRAPERSRERGRSIRITHAGNLYGQRDPSPLLKAAAELVRGGRLRSDGLEMVFVGAVEPDIRLRETAEELGLAGMVRILPKMPHRKALELLAQSDILLLIQPKTAVQTPSKLFEYMALKLPILALTDPGAAREIIERGRLGIAASPNDEAGVREALAEVTGGTYQFLPDEDFILSYSGNRLSSAFERIVIDALSNGS